MNIEDKLEVLKGISNEIESLEMIISKLSSGPGNYEISITQGLIPGVLHACLLRKSELMLEAQTLMK